MEKLVVVGGQAAPGQRLAVPDAAAGSPQPCPYSLGDGG